MIHSVYLRRRSIRRNPDIHCTIPTCLWQDDSILGAISEQPGSPESLGLFDLTGLFDLCLNSNLPSPGQSIHQERDTQPQRKVECGGLAITEDWRLGGVCDLFNNRFD